MPKGKASLANSIFFGSGPDGQPWGPSDFILHDETPPTMGPRQSEGLEPESVKNDPSLYTLFANGQEGNTSMLGNLAQKAYAKGPGDALGTAGWANDFFDVQDNNNFPVLSSTPNFQPGITRIHWPVNGGKFRYARFTVSLDPQAVLSRQQNMNNPNGGNVYGGGTNPYVSTPTPGVGVGPGQAKRAYELTLLKDGRFFYALTAQESRGQDSPHTGITAAGPGMWPASFGKPSDAGLPDGLYLLSVSPQDVSPSDPVTIDPGTGIPDFIVPATKAYRALIEAAQQGDPGALEAANALSIEIPNAGWVEGLFQSFREFGL